MPDRSSPDQTGDYKPGDDEADEARTTLRTGEWSPPPVAASVLKALGPSLGSVPRVHLREPDTSNVTPVNLPDSPEMPTVPTGGGPSRLQLLGEIARGGMGAVLKGRDVDLGRDIAVKVLLDSHAGSAELARRFLEEAQISGQLQHPGIVPVYELGVFPDSRPYFTMKLVKGKTLAALLAARKNMRDERAKYVGIFAQVCQTLAYAHARGVLHRDLKPSNIMVGSFGEVQVMDWGLAKVLSRGGAAAEAGAEVSQVNIGQTPDTPELDSRTQAGSVLGTPAYMAPEQARGEISSIDERADVFGLGGVLCEILTGKPPFTGRMTDAQHKAQTGRLEEAFARLDDCGAEAELIALAKRCLAAEPGHRLKHAGEVAEAITGYQQSVAERLRQAELARAAEEARAIEAQATAQQERKAKEAAQAKALAERHSRRMAVALAATVLLTVGGGGGIWLWLRSQQEIRLERNNGAIRGALSDALSLQERARKAHGTEAATQAAQAREQIQRANALVESGPSDSALTEQVQALRAELDAEDKDRQLLAALESARLAQADVNLSRGRRFEAELAVPLFRAAFAEYGLSPGEEDAQQAAARLNQRPAAVREALLAALDEWLSLAGDPRGKVQEPHLDWLRAVLAAAEPEGWGKQVREAAAVKEPAQRRAALEKLAQTADVPRLPPRALTLLADRLQNAAAPASALKLLRQARLHHAGDFWINLYLGIALAKAKEAEAVAYMMAAVALRPDYAEAHNALAFSLREQRRFEQAVAEFHKSIQLNPEDSNSYHGLGLALSRLDKTDEAIAAYRKAIEVDPKFPNPHNALGFILAEQNKPDEAIAEFRKAIELDPDFGYPHYNLGNVLREQGRFTEAVAEFRKAAKLEPDVAFIYHSLGLALLDRGEVEEAITAFRKAIELDPKMANPHNGLGGAYREQGKFAEAVAEYRKALQIDPDFTFARNNLRLCERWLELDRRLPQLLRGEIRPANAAEQLEYARLCEIKKRNAAAARLYAEGFKADPKLAENLRSEARYDAACAAALAANGQGEDASQLDAKERSRWRKQAVDWLRAELSAYAKLWESGKPKDRAWLREELPPWLRDRDLSSIRSEDALAKLPQEEQQACRKLWADVEALLTKMREGK